MKTHILMLTFLCLFSIETYTSQDCAQQPLKELTDESKTSNDKWAPEQIHSLKEIENTIHESKNALIIFDVDEVLITTKDIFIHPECDEVFIHLVRKKFTEVKTEEEKQELENRLSLSMLQPERVLVDASTPNFIKELQEKGIKTLALTSCQTGPFGIIPHVEHWRINQLKSLGIDFSSSFDSIEPLKLTEIEKKDRPAPLFEQGILFSKGYSKGEVLEAFLKRLSWMPSEVIFIDDLAESHQSLKQHLEALHIPFRGFQYEKAKLPQEKINKNLIEFQFNYLIENGEWIDDNEVANRMKLENFSNSIPSIDVSLEKSLLDQEINIMIRKLHPKEVVTIQASTVDDNNIKWVSNGSFEADDCGIVDLATHSPITGSYEGTDPMGLLWSMQPESGNPSSFKIKREEFAVNLKVIRERQEIASKEIIRLRKSSEVKQIPVQEDGLVGLLFMPPSENPLPVIITLSGSNGGLGESRAQLLASHGFAVLALGYFGVEGLPSNLQDIPLEYFETAFNWIKKQKILDSLHVGIYGVSRGGELALILGAWFPESVQSIVAVVPSSVIYGGLSETPVHAWRYHGKPIAPFAPIPPIDLNNGRGCDAVNPANTLTAFLEGMKNKKAFNDASIPVEKIQASLLIISGGDDQMWPSSIYALKIEERLQKNSSCIYRKYLDYPKAGHCIIIPNLPQSGSVYYHPVGKKWFTMGGSTAEDQHASQDSWKKIIEFFNNSLKPYGDLWGSEQYYNIRSRSNILF